jgi:hypothetical protein
VSTGAAATRLSRDASEEAADALGAGGTGEPRESPCEVECAW